MTGRATMTGNATMTRRATGCLKKSGPRKRVLAIFSCWMVLYGPKQCCMIRAYRCAALDTPLAYIQKKIDPRPPGAQKRAKKALLGPSTEKSECRAAKPPIKPPFFASDGPM